MQADEHRPFLRVEHISYREEEQVQEREQEVEDTGAVGRITLIVGPRCAGSLLSSVFLLNR